MITCNFFVFKNIKIKQKSFCIGIYQVSVLFNFLNRQKLVDSYAKCFLFYFDIFKNKKVTGDQNNIKDKKTSATKSSNVSLWEMLGVKRIKELSSF